MFQYNRHHNDSPLNTSLKQTLLLLVLLVSMALQGIAQGNTLFVSHDHNQTMNVLVSASPSQDAANTSSYCDHNNAMELTDDMAAMNSHAEINCCGDDCQCYTEHCFNTGGAALLQRIALSAVIINRTTASGLLKGQLSHPTFKQFRPPKVLITV